MWLSSRFMLNYFLLAAQAYLPRDNPTHRGLVLPTSIGGQENTHRHANRPIR